MAINFEAANMAGYNNPKIEVFVVPLNSDTSIATAPSKSELINCIQRGSIPFLLMRDPEQLATWLLPLTSVFIQSSGNYEFSFCTVNTDSPGAYTILSIFYPEAKGTPPILNFKELQ